MKTIGYSVVSGRLTEKIVKSFGASAGGAFINHCEYIRNLELHPADETRYSKSSRRKRKVWEYSKSSYILQEMSQLLEKEVSCLE